jgi:hypothetical protein
LVPVFCCGLRALRLLRGENVRPSQIEVEFLFWLWILSGKVVDTFAAFSRLPGLRWANYEEILLAGTSTSFWGNVFARVTPRLSCHQP